MKIKWEILWKFKNILDFLQKDSTWCGYNQPACYRPKKKQKQKKQKGIST